MSEEDDDDYCYPCPGCHAFPGEPHPPWCPDAALERARREEEDLGPIEPTARADDEEELG